MFGKIGKLDRFSVLMVLGFILLAAFLTYFFYVMSLPGYWHYADIGTYLARSFFIIDKGLFAEIPYWNYGYGYVTATVYPPFFFIVNAGLFHAFTAAGFGSVYWSFFATFLLSYAFAFAVTWKVSRKSSLAYLLTAGNIFSLGLLVLMGFNTKIFAFNLCFPAMVYLLDRRHDLDLGKKALAGFAVLFAAVFTSQLFMFLMFALFYLCVVLSNSKTRVKGWVPLLLVPVLTFPYFASFFYSIGSELSTAGIGARYVGMAANFYVAILVLFVALFLLTRERFMAPLALIAGLFALNLHAHIPFLANLETHSSTLFFLGIICYYLVNYDFSKRISLNFKRPGFLSRRNVLIALALFFLLFNFAYFPARIEKANLFNKPEYRALYEFGELESVFFVADMEELHGSIGPFVSYQTFAFHNYSVNDWFTFGKPHYAFMADRAELVEAIKQNDCGKVGAVAEKMRLKTLAVKNLPPGFSCLEVEADLGEFKVLKRA